MKDAILTISSKGQITLPSATRKRLSLHQGDRLSIVTHGRNQVVLEKQKTFKDYIGKFSDTMPQDATLAVRELRDRE